MSYCIGAACKKSLTCKNHISTDPYDATVDWSTYGSGRISGNGDCEVTYYCGDDSIDYPKYQPIDGFLDKSGKLISEGDIIRFDNGHRFKCVVVESTYCLLCLDLDLPLIVIDKLCLDKTLYSGAKEGI